MKYFSTFSGIGGFELGIKQAYENYNKQIPSIKQNKKRRNGQTNKRQNLLYDRQLSSLCIGYSETDKYATQVYEKQFNHKNYGDITKIRTKDLPKFELLVGGFPCQAFSIAGKRKGFNDTRGTLFFDLARILRDKRPRYFLLENVKGLLSHDSGKTFQTILGVLTDLGYRVEWQVLNSKNFGVPQKRERVFIIGYFGRTPRPKIFPIEESNSKIDVSFTIDSNYYKGINTGSCGGKSSFEKMRRQTVGDLPNMRLLTPVECERLQGFPDDWTKIGKVGTDCSSNVYQGNVEISDTQRYKMCGNAVTVNVVENVISRLL